MRSSHSGGASCERLQIRETLEVPLPPNRGGSNRYIFSLDTVIISFGVKSVGDLNLIKVIYISCNFLRVNIDIRPFRIPPSIVKLS